MTTLVSHVSTAIDSPITWEQLTSPDSIRRVVKPLLSQHTLTPHDALLAREIFLQRADADPSMESVHSSRAALCELLAIRSARQQLPGLDLATSITSTGALELAVTTEAKRFLASSAVRQVVRALRSGRIVHPPTRSGDDWPSRQRTTEPHHTGVYTYDPRAAGWLDHTRLRIPCWRARLEVVRFIVLAILFASALAENTLGERLFMAYGFGFVLDELAAFRSPSLYLANAWNAFDASFSLLFIAYAVLRYTRYASLALSLLACCASVLLPRLCFFLVQDDVLVIALKAMIGDFVSFMLLAALCFSGILVTLWTLGRDRWTLGEVAWLMLQIWFGSSYLGFSSARSFHPVLGPILLVAYAALSNTLLVTILISILSGRYARVSASAVEEHAYQVTVATLECLEADTLGLYPPPANLLALLFVRPLSLFLSPHDFHRVNVAALRLSTWPALLIISLWERASMGRIKLEDAPGGDNNDDEPEGDATSTAELDLLRSQFEDLQRTLVKPMQLDWINVGSWSPSESTYRDLVARLDPDSQKRIAKFHFRHDALRFLAGRLLVQRRLGSSTLSYAANGKPYIPGALPFNISHDGDVVMLLVGGDSSPVGVDVMHVDRSDEPDLAEVLREHLAPAELAASPDLPTMIRRWTIKEAVVKRSGDGLATPLKTVVALGNVNSDGSVGGCSTCSGSLCLSHPGHLRVGTLHVNGQRYAFAAIGDRCALNIHEIPIALYS